MSRAWTVAVVGLAGVAMWLVVGRPQPATKSAPAELESEEPAVALPRAPRELPPPAKPASPAPEPVQTGEDDEESQQEPTSPSPAVVAKGPQGDILEGDRGPVEEYRALYARQARDSDATTIEEAIRTAFSHSKTPDLMQSVSCHESICKVLIRWAPERARDYILAARWLAPGAAWPPGTPGFESSLAITTVSDTDRDGTRLVELYVKRRSPTAPPPSAHAH